MVLYGGMDLHGDNVFCTVIDQEYRPVFERRLPNALISRCVVMFAPEPDYTALKASRASSTAM